MELIVRPREVLAEQPNDRVELSLIVLSSTTSFDD
jgi:hypothetical protein